MDVLDNFWRNEVSLIRSYLDRMPRYADLAREVAYVLEKEAARAAIQIASVSFRAKSLGSYLEKIARKGYGRDSSKVTDCAGVRLVYLYSSDLVRIDELISGIFMVEEYVDKSKSQSADQFGYGAIHYIVTIGDSLLGPRYDGLRDLSCEIQVRTVLQDAWAVVAHHLEYKREEAVPRHLRRKLHALAGSFEVADAHLEQLRNQREVYIEELYSKESDLQLEINRETLLSYLSKKFPDIVRLEIGRGFFYELLEHLREQGYRTIGDVDELLMKTKKAREKFNAEEDFGPAKAREVFVALGFVHKVVRMEFVSSLDRKLLGKYDGYVER